MQSSILRPIRWVLLSLAPFILLIGIGILVYAVFQSRRVEASRTWPSTAGRLLDTKVRMHTSSSGGATRPGTTHRRKTSYYLEVEYEYTVDGQSYRNDTITLGATVGGDKASQNRLADALRRADPLLVYYDPDSPAVATLRPGESSAVIVLYIVGGGFAAFACLWVGAVLLITKQ